MLETHSIRRFAKRHCAALHHGLSVNRHCPRSAGAIQVAATEAASCVYLLLEGVQSDTVRRCMVHHTGQRAPNHETHPETATSADRDAGLTMRHPHPCAEATADPSLSFRLLRHLGSFRDRIGSQLRDHAQGLARGRTRRGRFRQHSFSLGSHFFELSRPESGPAYDLVSRCAARSGFPRQHGSVAGWTQLCPQTPSRSMVRRRHVDIKMHYRWLSGFRGFVHERIGPRAQQPVGLQVSKSSQAKWQILL
jgi:hypothetical protein